MTTNPKGRWGSPAGPSAVLAPVVAAALLLTGCAVGDAEEPTGAPKRDLAVRPEALPTATTTTTAAPTAVASGSPGATPGSSAAGTPRPGTTTAPGTGPAATSIPAPPGEGPYRAV